MPVWRRSSTAVFGLLLIISVVITSRGEAQKPTSPSSEPSQTQQEEIDFDKARKLFERRQRGEKLTAEEEDYLQRAMIARRSQQTPNARQPVARTPQTSMGLKPLTEMTADDRYKGQDGGLYGQGRNTPPGEHRAAADRALRAIEPLNAEGRPAPDGKIVFVSISMSNATQEFSRFKQLADGDSAKSTRLTIVDCAQGGQAMAEWAPPNAEAWSVAERRLAEARVSPSQVQVAWIKLANKGPNGDLEAHGRKLQRDTTAVIQNAKTRFPNLRVAYLSSRIYGGYATGNLNPEPYAYESAFVARWLIQSQMAGEGPLNMDENRGPVQAPVLLWGPYLWADGTSPRQSDKLVYTREDLAQDGTHPSSQGRDKVARLMLEFFKTEPLAKSWFLK